MGNREWGLGEWGAGNGAVTLSPQLPTPHSLFPIPSYDGEVLKWANW